VRLSLAACAALLLQSLLGSPAPAVCWGVLVVLIAGAAWLRLALRDPGDRAGG
jgi:hypothetical protein